MTAPVVAGLGQIAVVFAGRVPRLPDSDAPVGMSELAMQPGGTATVALGVATAFGCQTRLAGRVAQDPLGAFVLGALDQAGIDTELVDIANSRLTGFRFAAVSSDGRRHGFHSAGDTAPPGAGEVDIPALLHHADAFVIDGHAPAAQIEVATAARARAVPVIFDGSRLCEGVGDLVGLADVLISSERLAAELSPGDPGASLRELSRMGPRAVVITMGEAGCVGMHAGRVYDQPALPVPMGRRASGATGAGDAGGGVVGGIDTADAGDVFLGAFVVALLAALPFAHCLRFASAAAALSCASLGAWAGIPDRGEVLALLRGEAASGDAGAGAAG